MLGTFKPDKSNLGHALEALLISLVIMGACAALTGAGVIAYTLDQGFLLGSALALAWYIGREKRDCETGLDLPSGSPRAWLLMWVRWKNLLDLVGPALVHAVAWAIYLDLFPSGAL